MTRPARVVVMLVALVMLVAVLGAPEGIALATGASHSKSATNSLTTQFPLGGRHLCCSSKHTGQAHQSAGSGAHSQTQTGTAPQSSRGHAGGSATALIVVGVLVVAILACLLVGVALVRRRRRNARLAALAQRTERASRRDRRPVPDPPARPSPAAREPEHAVRVSPEPAREEAAPPLPDPVGAEAALPEPVAEEAAAALPEPVAMEPAAALPEPVAEEAPDPPPTPVSDPEPVPSPKPFVPAPRTSPSTFGLPEPSLNGHDAGTRTDGADLDARTTPADPLRHLKGEILNNGGDSRSGAAPSRRRSREGDGAFRLGEILFDRGNVDGAAAAWRVAVSRRHARAATRLGMLLEQTGDLEGARQAYRDARRLGDPTGGDRGH